MNKNLIEKIAPQLTELMIKKMETLTEEWRKPWIADLAHGLPRNLRGTPYRGGNTLMLLFLSEIAGYRTPLFTTFKQAKEEGLNILKGSGSFPVFFCRSVIPPRLDRIGHQFAFADLVRVLFASVAPQIILLGSCRCNLSRIAVHPCSVGHFERTAFFAAPWIGGRFDCRVFRNGLLFRNL